MSIVTFMIGNGFDLACGLKSRYTDSYDEYVNSQSFSPEIVQFKKTIADDIPTWADFEMQLIDYALKLESESELITCLRDYDEFLNDFLVKEQTRFWNSIPSDESWNPILQEMERSLTRFYYGLTLNDVQALRTVLAFGTNIHFNFISFNYTNVFDSFLKNINNSMYVLSGLPHKYSSSEVLHIHGTLGGDVTLGVDNEEQIAKIPYNISNRAKRNLIKPFFLKSYDNNRLTQALRLISSSDIICIFGLSLGDSDLIWREQLARWLKTDGHHLVYYKHGNMQKKYHSTAMTKKMDDEEDCKEEFISMLFNNSLSEEEKTDIINRIHFPVGVSIFKMKDAISNIQSNEKKRATLKEKMK